MLDLKLLTRVILCLCIMQPAMPTSRQSGQKVEVHGTIKDDHQRPLSDIELQFSEGDFVASARTRGDGFYSVVLPSGTFTVSTKTADYCPQIRTFTTNGGPLSLDFVVIDCSACNLQNVDLSDSEPINAHPVFDVSRFEYRSERLDTGEDSNRITLLYGSKHVEGQSAVYSALTCPGWPRQKPAILYYRGYVLKATNIEYSSSSRQIIANNDITLFDGKDQKHFSYLRALIADTQIRVLESK